MHCILLKRVVITFFTIIKLHVTIQVKEYDAISRIDAWLTAQLLHIKKKIDSDDTIN